MKLSINQENELICLNYFILDDFKKIPITNENKKMYFEWSEQGKHKHLVNAGGIGGVGTKITGLSVLFQAKKWRGIHVHELYEEGVLEGSTPYMTLLGGYAEKKKRKWYEFWKPEYSYFHVPIPRQVVAFLKHEMFKGIDADTIERCYQVILHG